MSQFPFPGNLPRVLKDVSLKHDFKGSIYAIADQQRQVISGQFNRNRKYSVRGPELAGRHNRPHLSNWNDIQSNPVEMCSCVQAICSMHS